MDSSAESIERNQKLLDEKLKYTKVVEDWEKESADWTPKKWSHCFDKPKPKKIIKMYSVSEYADIIEKKIAETERIKNGKVVDSSPTGNHYRWLKYSLTEFTNKPSPIFPTYLQ